MAYSKTTIRTICQCKAAPTHITGDQVFYTGPNLPGVGIITNDSFNTVIQKLAEEIEEISTFNLEELNETFDNLISGNTVTITNHQSTDIILVHRNGLFRRPGVEYVRSAGVISFFQPFGSSTGSLGDGEVVSVVSLRQTPV